MKKLVALGLILCGTSAFAADACKIYLNGIVTSDAINKLSRLGYEIVDDPREATYELNTLLDETKRVKQSFMNPSTHSEDSYHEYEVHYRVLVRFSKNGIPLRQLDESNYTLSEHDYIVPTNKDIAPIQRKIIRKVGKCESVN